MIAFNINLARRTQRNAAANRFNGQFITFAEPTDDEWAMLDQAMHVCDNSRLGCQIKISEALDGLVVRLAPEQV